MEIEKIRPLNAEEKNLLIAQVRSTSNFNYFVLIQKIF